MPRKSSTRKKTANITARRRTRATPARATSGTTLSRKRAPYRPLLIIECDTDTLHLQGLSFADDLGATTRLLFGDVAVLKSTTRSDLLERLAALDGQRFETILVIAHSNASGIALAPDLPSSWETFPTWLVRFEPRKLFLVACQAGRHLPCAHVFRGLPALKELYASPINASASLARAMHFLLPILMKGTLKREDVEAGTALRMLNFLLTRQVLFRYTKDGISEVAADPLAAVAWTAFEHISPELFDGLSAWLDSAPERP